MGVDQARGLAALFGQPYDTIKLRRVDAKGACVPFHVDHSRRTMQVALNDDFEGGALVFANAAGLEVLDRAAGTATIHTHQAAHGVTRLVRGTRYGLFLCNTVGAPSPPPVPAIVQ